jgi:hypothetical protein
MLCCGLTPDHIGFAIAVGLTAAFLFTMLLQEKMD